MVSESAIVLSTFTLLHIGFVLNLIATASTYWVEGHAHSKNGSLEEAREGLWQYCDESQCGPIPSKKSRKHKLCRLRLGFFLYVISTAFHAHIPLFRW